MTELPIEPVAGPPLTALPSPGWLSSTAEFARWNDITLDNSIQPTEGADMDREERRWNR